MSLYDICVASGQAARVSVNHTNGYQDVMIFCHFPVQTSAVTTNTPSVDINADAALSTTLTACASTASEPTTCAPQPAEPQPAESPPPCSPPAKRTRKRQCEVELLREGEEESSLLLSPSPTSIKKPSRSPHIMMLTQMLASPTPQPRSPSPSPSSTLPPPTPLTPPHQTPHLQRLLYCWSLAGPLWHSCHWRPLRHPLQHSLSPQPWRCLRLVGRPCS
jgi:hypothetical protein